MNHISSVDILLAEDTDADAEMIARALRKGGAVGRVLRVRDGVEALDYIFGEGTFDRRCGGQPKLIILDVKMPRLGGLDVLRRIKISDDTQLIPVVMLTSSAEDCDIAASYRFGASSYLVKPADSTVFATMVAQAGSYWVRFNRLPAAAERSARIP